MSCDDCDKETELKEKAYYFRIGKGDVLVFGCAKHVKMLQEKIRDE